VPGVTGDNLKRTGFPADSMSILCIHIESWQHLRHQSVKHLLRSI